MRATLCPMIALGFGVALAAEPAPPPPPKEAPKVAFELKSTAFAANGAIPVEHTCDGKDLSPPLSWSGAPAGTKSFALIMDDPDAPPGTWVHWVLYDLPGTTTSLPAGVARGEKLEGGGVQGLCWGVESFTRVGYYGPCPPAGSPHHYHFKLYALGAALGLTPKSTKDRVLKAMEGHVLAETELVGVFGR